MTVADELDLAVVDVGMVEDPVAVVAALAGLGMFGDYVVYERPGEWVFAAAADGTVELDAGEVRVSWHGDERRQPWSGRPALVLEAALAALPMSGRAAYGWIGFEFCAYAYAADGHVPPGTALARLLIPRIEVRIAGGRAQVTGAADAELATIRDALMAVHAMPVPSPASTAVDEGDYRGRVAAAIAEIKHGKYQKVILSREVELPGQVDIPATYRAGRAANSPARSFLLEIDGLEAAGFSPELVMAVSADGTVVTEPLAGTRAFGRGAAADAAARNDLEDDPKEIVEHAISVRTSLAEIIAVAEPGSATVADFMSVRERGSVQHLASTVRGQLSTRHSPWEALEALFPSVTASGIPKQPAVDAIFRLDANGRGLYSGAVVTVSADGGLEAALVLRAIYQSAGRAWLRAGAGVIGQSSPEREFEETCEKLASVAPYVVPAS